MNTKKEEVTRLGFIIYVALFTSLCIRGDQILLFIFGIFAAIFSSIRGLIASIPVGVRLLLLVLK